MARKSKRAALVDTFGQHLALAVAAHLARTQLVPDPLNSYDAQHLRESVEAIASALVRVTTLYVKDAVKGEPRQLAEAEIQGAVVKNGAENLVLTDGRKLAGVSIKRADLRQAIAVLKAVGIPELTRRTEHNRKDRASDSPADGGMARLSRHVDEIESLLALPLVQVQVDSANKLLIVVARAAPHGRISNLAMRLMSAVHDARNGGDEAAIRVMLARLRSAVDQATKSDEQARSDEAP